MDGKISASFFGFVVKVAEPSMFVIKFFCRGFRNCQRREKLFIEKSFGIIIVSTVISIAQFNH